MPKLVFTLCQSLPGWRREHADLPALTWSNFHAKTREFVNPLVSEEKMKMVATALHDMGEVRLRGREGGREGGWEGGREGGRGGGRKGGREG